MASAQPNLLDKDRPSFSEQNAEPTQYDGNIRSYHHRTLMCDPPEHNFGSPDIETGKREHDQ